MHPCLLIPEVLQQIFSNFDLSGTEQNCFTRPDRRVARHSLAALCRVCRSFKDVALDVLWVELLNLQPLFTRLPQDLWHAPGDGTLVRMLSWAHS
ncbi:hypothetical protein K503DRAFT_453401 [Rhizopogon vinicolor AM-OR11-026]|uniref:Uncharacterized protein n=1 Tax=Rhizopogon vinicolor AM-OR11-026 TaxID=1314800 RepID=A0A1B7MP84_9AGAM|nr:hypothetical protein K503DRAFT_453401 [Rhizopogon vinicolor AM-OR11-026]